MNAETDTDMRSYQLFSTHVYAFAYIFVSSGAPGEKRGLGAFPPCQCLASPHFHETVALQSTHFTAALHIQFCPPKFICPHTHL